METKKRNSLSVRITNYLYFAVLVFLLAYYLVFEISIFAISKTIENIIYIGTIRLTLLLFLMNIKRIKFDSYVVFFVLFFLLAYIQTYNFDKNIFQENLLPYLTSASMVFLCITRLKEQNPTRIKIIEYIQLIMIFFILVVDIISIKPLFIDGIYKGVMHNRNAFGAYNSGLFILSLNNVFKYKDKKIKVLFIITALLAIATILSTKSRASLLAVIAYLALLFIFYLKKNFKTNKKTILIICAFILLIILVFAKPLISYFFRNSFNSGNILISVLSGRYEIWFNAFPSVMKGHWLFGNGVYTIREATIRTLYSAVNTSGINYSLFHCLPLDITYSGGITGLVFITVAIIEMISCIKKQHKKDNFLSKLSVYTIICFLIAGLFDIYFIWDTAVYNYLILFLELGKLLNNSEGDTNEA